MCLVEHACRGLASHESRPRARVEHLQGYLAHKKHPPPRTLQSDYTSGPTVVLGVGLFLMSEVPLNMYIGSNHNLED